MIDFSKFNNKDVPKILPFPGSTGEAATSSSIASSSSSSYSSVGGGGGAKYSIGTGDSEGQRSAYQSVVTESSEGKDLHIIDDDDGSDTDSSPEDMLLPEQVFNHVM